VTEAGKASASQTVLLLHGFPDFWYSWRHQVPVLARAGYRVIAPDLRGCNLSGKPPRVLDYAIEQLVSDVCRLSEQLDARDLTLMGHDWGGIIAWQAAMWRPELFRRLIILNAPHPAAYLRELRHARQLLRSWYVFFFQLPWLPEALSSFDDFSLLEQTLRDSSAVSPIELRHYRTAWQQPGALRSAINYYRAAGRRNPFRLRNDLRPIDVPTLLIWGERDRYLVAELTRGLEEWVRHLRIERMAAGHWVHWERADDVNRLIISFLSMPP
jgi:pimeloyl-ACP methyl ester carboxylesterase